MLDGFKLVENRSSITTEAFAGLSSFLASFYIIIVNPAILSQAGLSYEAVSTATVLVAAFSTILMGLYANNPIVLAPGMGLNAFFAFSIVIGEKIPADVALGIVFWSGTIFLLLSVFKIRDRILALIPRHLRYAISCGIGLFIAFIGFIKGEVIVQHPVTLVQMAPVGPVTLTFFVCLALTGFLVWRGVRGALVVSILMTLVFSLPLGRWWGEATFISWKGLYQAPDFSLFGTLNLRDSFSLSLLPTILAFMFTDLFDTLSTLVGVFEAGNLLDENGEPRNLKRSLVVDAIATMSSGVFGTSPTTSFIESAAGIQQGGRTGLSSVIAGLLFIPFLFLGPLLSMFPVFTTAPVLVTVGIFMLAPIKKVDWQRMDVALPSFLAMALIPLTFSITKGLIAGLLCHYAIVMLRKMSNGSDSL